MSRRVLASLAAGGLLLAGASVLNPATAADETLPRGYPTPGCTTATDGASDGSIGSVDTSGKGGAPNDPDLDIKSVAIHTAPESVEIYVGVDKLATKPTAALGHSWAVSFTALTKGVKLFEEKYDNATLDGQFGKKTVTVATKVVDVPLSVTEDTAHSMVVFNADRATLETALGGPLVPGTAFANFGITSSAAYGATSDAADQLAIAKANEYTVGNDVCFPPPPSKLENFSDDTVQYGDQAEVVTQLTNDLDEALEGKTVTFSVGAKKITAVTDEEGVATAMFDPGALAGHVNLITTFAGDDNAGAVTLSSPLIVTQEKTKTTATAGRSGTKRTVTAKVLDDDSHPVAGQTVTFLVGTKKLGTAKTSSAGIAVFSGGTAGQTIVASFTAVAGKYLASKAPGVKV
jgi:hypothetical protein